MANNTAKDLAVEMKILTKKNRPSTQQNTFVNMRLHET